MDFIILVILILWSVIFVDLNGLIGLMEVYLIIVLKEIRIFLYIFIEKIVY